MRSVPLNMERIWRSGEYVGDQRPMVRVTVQHPQMKLHDFDLRSKSKQARADSATVSNALTVRAGTAAMARCLRYFGPVKAYDQYSSTGAVPESQGPRPVAGAQAPGKYPQGTLVVDCPSDRDRTERGPNGAVLRKLVWIRVVRSNGGDLTFDYMDVPGYNATFGVNVVGFSKYGTATPVKDTTAYLGGGSPRIPAAGLMIYPSTVPYLIFGEASADLTVVTGPNGATLLSDGVTERAHQTYANFLFNNATTPLELDNVKSVSWRRSIDAATADMTLTLKNLYRSDSTHQRLDQPGYYTPGRGSNAMAKARWSQSANAFSKMLQPDNLIKTYEGYGCAADIPPERDPNLVLTGVWLIDSTTATVDGLLTVQCRDVGRILSDQLIFPPVVPKDFYPLVFDKGEDVTEEVVPAVIRYPERANAEFDYTSNKFTPAGETTPGGAAEFNAPDLAIDDRDDTVWHSNGFRNDELKAPTNAPTTIGTPFSSDYRRNFTEFFQFRNAGAPFQRAVITWEGTPPLDVAVSLFIRDDANDTSDEPAGHWMTSKLVPTASGYGQQSVRQGDARWRGPEVPQVWATDNRNKPGGGGANPTFIDLPQSIPNVQSIRFTWPSPGYDPFSAPGSRRRTGIRRLDVYDSIDGIETTPAVTRPGSLPEGANPGWYYNYTNIVKLLAAWGGLYWPKDGFQMHSDGTKVPVTFRDADQTVLGKNVDGRVWGDFQLTATAGDNTLDVDVWDKKTLMDGIQYCRDIVGAIFYIDESGAAVFRLPNLYQPGNWLTLNTSPGFTTSMYTIDETQTLMNLSSAINSANVREGVFVSDGSGQTAAISGGYNPNPTGLRRWGGWTDSGFKTQEEMQRMADMITIRQLMTYRKDTLTIPGFPGIQVDDQVRILEEVTGESYLHYISGINSTLDLDAGTYTYELTTNWLGDAEGIARTGITNPRAGAYVVPRRTRAVATFTPNTDSTSPGRTLAPRQLLEGKGAFAGTADTAAVSSTPGAASPASTTPVAKTPAWAFKAADLADPTQEALGSWLQAGNFQWVNRMGS